MSLEDLISRLDTIILNTDAKVALLSDNGALDETSLLGTREGYLRLAKELLAMVQAADQEALELDEQGQWTETVKAAFYHFPSFGEPSVVGAYICSDHSALRSAMANFFGAASETWENDPQFDSPTAKADHENL